MIVATLLATAGCGGAASGGTPGVASPLATAQSETPSAPAASLANATPGRPAIQFDVKGTIGGHAIEGRVANPSFTVACQGAGPDQILTVHWEGDAPANTLVQGEIDFKPGTWTLGSSSAQGSATIGVQGGKAIDALVGSSGTVTTAPGGGTIDGTFTGGSDSLQLSGSWTCPATS